MSVSVSFSVDDHSRVRLQRNNVDYINASLVEVPGVNRAYILTQVCCVMYVTAWIVSSSMH